MEMEIERLRGVRDAIRHELLDNILPFWIQHAPDTKRGGFVGRLSNDLVPEENAPKGLILNARILWTFAAAHRLFPDTGRLAMAETAVEILFEHFWDPVHGGVYWMVNPDGKPVDAKKKVYGQAFFIYALAEFLRIRDDAVVSERARRTFELIEKHAYDAPNTGYFETCERDWALAADLRLSDKDLNEAKSMNTHLHLMEAYANLFRVWKEPLLRRQLIRLVRNFLDRIIDPAGARVVCFFNEQWEKRSGLISYGHDIETSWLLCEAAELTGDPALEKEVRSVAVRMAEAVFKNGRDEDGSLFYEIEESGRLDTDKHFWVEAEAVVGFLNAYRLSGDARFLDAANRAWEFIRRFLVDRKHGDWFYRTDREGRPFLDIPKISEWKCPYHSSRMCMESVERIDAILKGSAA
jgi:cellobiose epimerase